ncbi:MAG: 4-diphosphocytidyl-2C-methyl-D-erythritol kinase [Alphaproteobacteria bacterium]|nr:4-diphosphocytidyl-2C-methyl-D-erythritol kinase [Alphaproteobacteria bacterium]
MKFLTRAVAEAEGTILAHSHRVDTGKLAKGHRLTKADVARLQAAGIAAIAVVELEASDIGEDEAAARAAAAVAGAGTKVGAAFTGRANINARAHGLAVIDSAAIDALNAIHEALTIATVAPFEPAEPDQLLATVKVIPLGVPRAALDRWVATAPAKPPVALAPFRPHDVGLVLTRLPGLKESVLDKTAAVQAERLTPLGSRIVEERRVAHTVEAVAAALADLLAQGCDPILVFGASAVIDRRDVVPAAIERAGGTIERLGMPVDPGNLLLLARHGRTAILGLPGSARSPRLNGYDHVLRRILAGVPVAGADLARLGVGGLLKEIPGRPQPREPEPPPRAAKIAALVLAAGQSRRMGEANKLLADVAGTPMVRRTVQAIAGSRARPIVVVTGHQAEAVRAALAGLDVAITHNPRYAEGLSTSLAHGIRALPSGTDGAVVCLADMPEIRAEHIDRLIAAFAPAASRAIGVPTRRGKRGNPVLWGAQYFAALTAIAGDVGARHLIGEHADRVYEVAMDDDAIFLDIDTPAALAALRAKGA